MATCYSRPSLLELTVNLALSAAARHKPENRHGGRNFVACVRPAVFRTGDHIWRQMPHPTTLVRGGPLPCVRLRPSCDARSLSGMQPSGGGGFTAGGGVNRIWPI